MSRNENHQLPLHFAVRMNRPQMVALLVELGADPLGVDGSGSPAAAYATTPDIDHPVMERIRSMTLAELSSAERGHRRPNVQWLDLMAALALGDFGTAERLWREHPRGTESDGPYAGVLHLMSKRGDLRAVQWLLGHGADPSARWSHWGADVTPLHLAALGNHPHLARVLVDAGADPTIKDSMHDSDALGWAEFFGRVEIVKLLSTIGR
jgi:ankyrin repeat protein